VSPAFGAAPKATALTVADRVGRSDGAICAEVDGEVVALDAERGVCYGLNRVASHVWGLIDPPARIGEVCTSLINRYDVDAATCERQVLDLLEDLRGEGLIVIAATSASSTTPEE
jgi:hypothetical protein